MNDAQSIAQVVATASGELLARRYRDETISPNLTLSANWVCASSPIFRPSLNQIRVGVQRLAASGRVPNPSIPMYVPPQFRDTHKSLFGKRAARQGCDSYLERNPRHRTRDRNTGIHEPFSAAGIHHSAFERDSWLCRKPPAAWRETQVGDDPSFAKH